MKKFLTFLMFFLLATIAAQAEEKPDYTLTPAAGSNNTYTGNCDITVEGITWNVTGNAQQIPWRLGGKSISKVDRTVYSKTAFSKALRKVDLTIGAASSITINSIKLVYSTNADFSNATTLTASSTKASTTHTFAPVGGFPANAYYKFVFNLTVSSTSNKFVEFNKVEFYTNEGGSDPDPEPTKYTVTVATDIANGTVTANPTSAEEGAEITLTATPATGYEFGEWNVTNASTNAAISVTDNKFTMPAADVNVSATFNSKSIRPENEIFYESFDTNDGTGGNDNSWSGTIASNDLQSDNEGWTFIKGNGADQCAKFGSGDTKGVATTPDIYFESGYQYTLNFKAAAWNTSSEKQEINISSTDQENGNSVIDLQKQAITLDRGQWKDFSITFTATSTGKSNITFEATTAQKNRFFIDEISITKSAIVPKTLTSITISGTPTKTTYTAGDTFEPAGLDVTGHYSDGSDVTITEGITWSTPDALTAGQTSVSITATVNGVTSAEYTVTGLTVTAPKTLIGIEATGTPAEFWKGDAFNHDGITVTATWDDESETDVTSSCSFSGYDMSTAGKQTVTVTYQEETDTYDIEVKTIANTQETAYTAAEAIALIDAGKDLATEVYVKGTVSKIVTEYSEQYGNITFNIEDGFQFYRNQKTAQYKYTEDPNIKVGDYVVGCGTLTKHEASSTYEFTAGNYLVKHDKVATLSIADITVELNEDIVPVITTNVTGEYLIEYTSDNENVVIAHDDELCTGDETGTATITATLVADGYKDAETTFTVTVAAKTYAINISENIKNGSVEASATRAAEGATVTLTATPADGYKFEAWSVTNATTSEAITVTDDNKFTMPAAAVNVSATFRALPTYTINWSVNGAIVKTDKNVVEGTEITAPEVSAIGDMEFTGWVTSETVESDATPAYVNLSNLKATADATYYAVFAKGNQGSSNTVTLTNAEIISLNNNKTAYTEEQTYTEDNITYSIYAYTDQPQRHWLQLKKDKGVYVKITAPAAISKVEATLTAPTNSSGGINDISKHNAFTGYVALVEEDCDYSTSSSSVASTNTITNNIATLVPSGNNNELYLKVSTGARIWEITTTYAEPTTYSNFTTLVGHFLKHNWNGAEEATWKKFKDNGNGTYTIIEHFGSADLESQINDISEYNVVGTEDVVQGNVCEFILTVPQASSTSMLKNTNEPTLTVKYLETVYLYSDWQGTGNYSWRPVEQDNNNSFIKNPAAYSGVNLIYWNTTKDTDSKTEISSIELIKVSQEEAKQASAEKNAGTSEFFIECKYTLDPVNNTISIEKNDIVTGIDDITVNNAVKAYKTIENGQVIIVRGDQRFNIMGQPVR